jgi:hypothetical protein
LNPGGKLIFHDIHLEESTLKVIAEVERELGIKRHETKVGVIYLEKNK